MPGPQELVLGVALGLLPPTGTLNLALQFTSLMILVHYQCPRHLSSAAVAVVSPTDQWFYGHEHHQMLSLKVFVTKSLKLLDSMSQSYCPTTVLAMRLWHSPCQRTPVGCNLVSIMLVQVGVQN